MVHLAGEEFVITRKTFSGVFDHKSDGIEIGSDAMIDEDLRDSRRRDFKDRGGRRKDVLGLDKRFCDRLVVDDHVIEEFFSIDDGR